MSDTFKSFDSRYFKEFTEALNNIVVTDKSGTVISFDDAVEKIADQLVQMQKSNNKVMMIGNGGSAGICSHMAVDYWKNGGIRSTAFNDTSLLTCISNDYSYAEVFSKPIEMFADKNDMAYCISSSGKSINIINGANTAAQKNCSVVTFSGFGEDNPLRKLGDFNFYVKSFSYGFVELIHNFIIHCILDAKLYCSNKVDIFNANKPF